MNKYQILALKSIRKVYLALFNAEKDVKPECIQDADVASKIIYDALMEKNPCMIARFGSTELACLINYVGVTQDKNKYLQYIQGKTQRWWWEQSIIKQMQNWSGFFPATQNKIEQFCQLMLEDIPEVDVLGSWLTDEQLFDKQLHSAQKVHLRLLEPFWSDSPWTKALEGKHVVVVHPFAETIEQQYLQRQFLFKDKSVLPTFGSLTVIKAVQTLGEGDARFKDWFEALEYMKSEIDKLDYDVCLIGCGAYGFHLAAHVKRSGKNGIHLGGALQLLFGIKGKRWEDPNYGVKQWDIPYGYYANLINEYWVRPGENDKPKNAEKVEGACYW
jgi:hypothetical protein